jgi:hypothetical protein
LKKILIIKNSIYVNFVIKGFYNNKSIWYHIKKCKIQYDNLKYNKDIQELRKEIKEEISKEVKTLNEKIENVKPNVFNLNVFLNEYCKDAMSIDTFLSQLQIQFTLNNTLEKDAIDALTNALTNMDIR